MKRKNIIILAVSFIVLAAFLWFADNNLSTYVKRILNLCAIYVVLGLGLNLINGITGLFSLGHAGFMLIGAYTTALFNMPISVKEQNFFLAPLIAPLNSFSIPFFPALLLGGLLAAGFAFLIGAPVLRLKGDYLAIATLGFAEIIRVVCTNLQNVTNGALGIKGIPLNTNLWWTYGAAVLTILLMIALIRSSFGKALKAIRDNEIAAEAMGINLFKHKVTAFIIGAFLAGIGGGLLGSLLGTIDPTMFKFLLSFNILLIVVLGGMGSITGTVISAFVITASQELLRFLDDPMTLGSKTVQLVGLRMVVFSAILIIVIIFFRNGLMGSKELPDIINRFRNKKPLTKEGGFKA